MFIIYAYLLDLVLGDPSWGFHPVRLMGKTISILEGWIRDLARTAIEKKIGGVLLLFITAFLFYTIPYLLIEWSMGISMIGGYILMVLLSYTTLSSKSLYQESMRVLQFLKKGDLEKARESLSMIVGRDTKQLSDKEIPKALIETISENTSDGIVAPLFYLVIGGVPLAFLYKAVNTLDSMVGYKNRKYREIGWASARLDDILNYIPARLTALIMILSSYFLGLDWKDAWRIFRRDGRNHLSPNAGMPEAAVAGALKVKLGGGSYYFGEYVSKPTIGDDLESVSSGKALAALRIMHLTSFLAVLSGAILYYYIPWSSLWLRW